MNWKVVGSFLSGVLVGIMVCAVSMYGATYYFMGKAAEYGDADLVSEEEHLNNAAKEIAAAESEYDRYLILSNVAFWQAASGMSELSKVHAEELLGLAENFKQDWNYSNAVHKAHMALGILALNDGNTALAIEHLKSAGEVEGSPQLNSFGPNMYLARELLKRGKVAPVINYLDSVGRFWSSDFGQLNKWKSMATEGQVPNFGANLVY